MRYLIGLLFALATAIVLEIFRVSDFLVGWFSCLVCLTTIEVCEILFLKDGNKNKS